MQHVQAQLNKAKHLKNAETVARIGGVQNNVVEKATQHIDQFSPNQALKE